ncbi:hypothetical protein DUNSADRAFT_5581 [Dunaliella salina]|uniref:Uncharacterized protein n=1 Tax=Dunaliella salina TaxID=3046 RepID=A0ABQ7GQ42_DUNSA|nr:hypothetical protein DUNSADRAFT_5581 [Dunaliella salina]|eukprot:KAF5836706.1 hypothetical protein DUNSADRAFT_5581 [Dunaliella salina]
MGGIDKSSNPLGFFELLPEHVWGEIYRHLGDDAPSKKALLQVHPRVCNSRWVHGHFSNVTVQLPEPVAAPLTLPTAAAPPSVGPSPAAAVTKSAVQPSQASLQPPAEAIGTSATATPDASLGAEAAHQAPMPAEVEWLGWLPKLSHLEVHIKRLIIKGSRAEKEPPFDEDLAELEQGFQLMHLMQQHDTAGMESDGPGLLRLLWPQHQRHAEMLQGLQSICFQVL